MYKCSGKVYAECAERGSEDVDFCLFFLNRSIWLYELYKVTTRVAKDTVLGSYRI